MAKYMKLRVAQKVRGHLEALFQLAVANGVRIPPAIDDMARTELEMFEFFATLAMKIEEKLENNEWVVTKADGSIIADLKDVVKEFETDEQPEPKSSLILPDEKKKIILLD